MLQDAAPGGRAGRRFNTSIATALSAFVLVLTACVPPVPPSAPSPLLGSPIGPGSVPRISADGSTVVVETLVPDTADGSSRVVAIDVATGAHEANPIAENCPDAISGSVSPTGRWVAYLCYQNDPDNGAFRSAATVWDRQTGTVTPLPGAADGTEAYVSGLSVGEGGVVALRCWGNCGVIGVGADTWVWDPATGTVTPAPLGDDGEAVETVGSFLGVVPQLNSSGTSVWIRSSPENVAARATQCHLLWDLPAGEWVGAGPEAADACAPAVSRDHRHLAGFDSAAGTLWVHDRQTGTTAVRADGPRGQLSTYVVAISDDGSRVWLSLQDVAGAPGRPVVWEISDSSTVVPMGAPAGVNVVAVDAESTRGVAISNDRRVWLLAT